MNDLENLGFTGSQMGMTPQQKLVMSIHYLPYAKRLHNGWCIGADEDCLKLFDKQAQETGEELVVVAHIPVKAIKKTRFVPQFCKVEWCMPFDYLIRNDHIATECDRLVATPSGVQEQLRSGTWSTIRRMLNARKPYDIIFPNGMIQKHHFVVRNHFMTTIVPSMVA